MLAYVKAYSRGLRWVYDTSNKEKAVDILVKYSKQDRKLPSTRTTISSPG